jgi:hypothetical protein
VSEDNKDYRLKVFEAWVSFKLKLVNFALIANGAVLATVFTFIKEKGPNSEGLFPLKLGALGILFGAIALRIVWLYSDNFLTVQFEGQQKLTGPQKPKKPQSERTLKWEKKIKTMAFTNSVFGFFLFASALCLVGSIAYFSGVLEGIQDFIATHPGSEKLLNKW